MYFQIDNLKVNLKYLIQRKSNCRQGKPTFIIEDEIDAYYGARDVGELKNIEPPDEK